MHDKASRRLLGLTLVMTTAITAYASYLRVRYPFTLDYEEGNILNAVARILGGANPYPAVGSFPYIINPYGPVGYYIFAAAARVFGLSFATGRTVALLATLGVGILIGILIHRYSRSRFAAMSFAALWFSTFLVTSWASLLRVDFIAVFFALLGLVIFRPDRLRVSLAAVLFVTAIFAKHTVVAAPAACFGYLLVLRRYRLAGLLAGEMAAVGSLALLAGQYWTKGALWFYLFQTHHDPYTLSQLVALYRLTAFFMLSVVFLFAMAWDKNRNLPRQYPLPFLYLAASVLTGITAGKMGSNINHLLELTVALCAVAGIGFVDLEGRNRSMLRLVTLLICLQTCFVLLWMTIPESARLRSTTQVECQRAYDYIASFHDQPVLSEDVGAMLLTGNRVLLSNPFVYRNLQRGINWQAGTMEQFVEQKRFQLVVLGSQDMPERRWSKQFMSALTANYVHTRHFGCSNVNGDAYVLKSAPAQTTHSSP